MGKVEKSRRKKKRGLRQSFQTPSSESEALDNYTIKLAKPSSNIIFRSSSNLIRPKDEDTKNRRHPFKTGKYFTIQREIFDNCLFTFVLP